MKIKNWEAILWDCLEEMSKIPDGSIEKENKYFEIWIERIKKSS